MAVYLGKVKVSGGGGSSNIVSCASIEEYMRIPHKAKTLYVTPESGQGGGSYSDYSTLSGMILSVSDKCDVISTDTYDILNKCDDISSEIKTVQNKCDQLQTKITQINDKISYQQGNPNCLDYAATIHIPHTVYSISAEKAPYDFVLRIIGTRKAGLDVKIDGISISSFGYDVRWSHILVSQYSDYIGNRSDQEKFEYNIPCGSRFEMYNHFYYYIISDLSDFWIDAAIIPYRYGNKLFESKYEISCEQLFKGYVTSELLEPIEISGFTNANTPDHVTKIWKGSVDGWNSETDCVDWIIDGEYVYEPQMIIIMTVKAKENCIVNIKQIENTKQQQIGSPYEVIYYYVGTDEDVDPTVEYSKTENISQGIVVGKDQYLKLKIRSSNGAAETKTKNVQDVEKFLRYCTPSQLINSLLVSPSFYISKD